MLFLNYTSLKAKYGNEYGSLYFFFIHETYKNHEFD